MANVSGGNGTESFDDRPISMYDNLNMAAAAQTSTPRTKAPTATATAPATATVTSANTASAVINGAIHSPLYADISFRFNDNATNRQPTVQQHQQQRPNQHLLASGGRRDLNRAPNTVLYATPYKSETTTTNTAVLPPPAPAAAQLLPSSSASPSPFAARPVTASNAPTSQRDRPLSQHSQSELNEASHSIAAVKAALNDAKSKFFGLNGYAQRGNGLPATNDSHPQIEAQTFGTALAPSDVSLNRTTVQTVPSMPTPPTKPTKPKYQNIPENSAIFRQLPPELPPKPSEVQKPHFADLTSAHRSSPSPSSSHTEATPKVSSSTAAAYKQVPLIDIDSTQPSQAVYMATTVPQNIKGSKIAGRHTPTRSSLRHSRMLVVNNKNFQEVQHPNPMGFKQPRLARWLLISELIVGFLLTSLAVWILFLAPNTAIQYNPYWSGLVLILGGIVGLVLIRFQRMKRSKAREHCFAFLRADSYLLSLLAVLLCCVALLFAVSHFARLTASDTKCESTNILLEHGSCACTFNYVDKANTTEPLADGSADEDTDDRPPQEDSYRVVYGDLSCQEVGGAWTTILGLSMVLNFLGFVVALYYLVLLACCRPTSKRLYTSVHTSTF